MKKKAQKKKIIKVRRELVIPTTIRSGHKVRLYHGPRTYAQPKGQPVPEDPVTAGIIAITAFETFTGVAIGFEVAATVGSIITTGVLVGASFAMNMLAKSQADQGGVGNYGASAVNSPEVRGTIRMAAAPQRIIYGRMLVGGVWSFYDDATPPYQYVQLMLCRGRISGVRSVMINRNRIYFSGGIPFNTILDPIEIEGQDYLNNLKVSFRQGIPDQAIDPILSADFPVHGTTPNEIVFDEDGNVTNLPASFRQRNIATATFKASFGDTREIFEARWGQVAFINPMVEVDGRPVYDPRDPTQDIDDEETWKFIYDGKEVGRNPSLQQCDWIRQPFGGRLRNDQIRIDELIEAANFDDETVVDKDGNLRPRHQSDGVIVLNENPKHVTEAMLTASRAWLVQSRGRVGWVPSIARDPITTLTEKDILGGFDFKYGPEKADTYNRIRTRFPAEPKDFAEDDGPILDRDDLRTAEDDGELLETTVRTPFTTDPRAIQWLAAQYLEESRLDKGLEVPTIAIRPRFLKLKVGDVVRVQHARYPEIDGIYQIMKDGYAADFTTLTWTLREYNKEIGSKDRSADEQDFEVAEAA